MTKIPKRLLSLLLCTIIILSAIPLIEIFGWEGIENPIDITLENDEKDEEIFEDEEIIDEEIIDEEIIDEEIIDEEIIDEEIIDEEIEKDEKSTLNIRRYILGTSDRFMGRHPCKSRIHCRA